MKHIKTQQQLNEASENLNISDVSDSDEIIKISKKDLFELMLNVYLNTPKYINPHAIGEYINKQINLIK